MTPITLMVPENLSGLSLKISESLDSEIQIESYNKLAKKNVDTISKEKFILLLNINEYKEHIGGKDKFVAELLSNGRIIILVNEQEFKNTEIPMVRGIDVMDAQPGEDLFNFKIKKTISEIEFEEEISTLKTYESRLDTLNEIGVALSTEENLPELLELIVSKSRIFKILFS